MESWSFWIEDALLTKISLFVVSCPSYSALRLAKTVKKKTQKPRSTAIVTPIMPGP